MGREQFSSPATGRMEVQVGEYDVLDSGVVTSPNNKPVNIHIAQNVEVEFRFNYVGEGEPSFSATPIDGKLVFELENFKSGVVVGGKTPPLGLMEPISIGVLFGRELLILFEVSTTQMNSKTAHSTIYYNFYLGEMVEEDDVEEGAVEGDASEGDTVEGEIDDDE